MAKRVTDLNELTGAAPDDELLIVDTSQQQTKRISLLNMLTNFIDAVHIKANAIITSKILDGAVTPPKLSYVPTKFVPITPTVVLNTDPGGASFADLDISSTVPAGTIAVVGTVLIGTAGSNTRTGYMRKKGTSLDTEQAQVVRCPTAPGTNIGQFTCEVDSNRVLQWRVSNADVNSFIVTIWGYHTTVT